MFSNLTIGLMLGVGFGTWVYSKIYRSTGGNNQNAIVVGVAAGVSTLIVTLIILGLVF